MKSGFKLRAGYNGVCTVCRFIEPQHAIGWLSILFHICTRFEWRIDDTFSFYGNWHAVLYPMQYDDPNEPNAVTQTLEVE